MIVGVAGVALTGWDRLDPIVALAVAANILVAGGGLLRRSAGGLMDRALEEPDLAAIRDALAEFERDGVRFHALRTRQAGSRRFVSLHVLVPGAWTVQRGHDLVERVEARLCERLPGASVFTAPRARRGPALVRGHATAALSQPPALAAQMEAGGIEPPLQVCKTCVLPLPLRPRELPLRIGGARPPRRSPR